MQLHFGNFLVSPEGHILSLIDWEFSGIGPAFHKTSDPLGNLMYTIYDESPKPLPPIAQTIIDTWPSEFLTRLKAKDEKVHDDWVYESDKRKVLGEKGVALADLREFLRSCVEVGVRDWGNVEKAKGDWTEKVQDCLRTLGAM